MCVRLIIWSVVPSCVVIFLGGSASAMGTPLQSFYPPSLYGVPTPVYPYQQPGAFPAPYGGGAGGGAGGTAGGAGSTAGGNFYAGEDRSIGRPTTKTQRAKPIVFF